MIGTHGATQAVRVAFLAAVMVESLPSYNAEQCGQRVAYVSETLDPALGHLDGSVWTLLVDSAFLSRAGRSPEPMLLYFTRAAYDQAIRKLTDGEVREVIQMRIKQWSPNAVANGANWLYESERRRLVLTAIASRAGPERVALLNGFQTTMEVLAHLVGNDRYDSLSLPSLLTSVLEGDAKLGAEASLPVEPTTAASRLTAQQWAELAKSSQQRAGAIARVLKSLGRPEFAAALPYVALHRAVFISRPDPNFVTSLRAAKKPYSIWREGLVTRLAVGEISALRKRGKSVQVLYYNPGEFVRDLHELTPAQRNREFAERMGTGGGLQSRREFLDLIWLEQHLLRRSALGRARKENSAVATLLAAQVAQEQEALRLALARFPAWVTEAERGTALAALDKSAVCAVEDERFLAELARLMGRPELESQYKQILSLKGVQ